MKRKITCLLLTLVVLLAGCGAKNNILILHENHANQKYEISYLNFTGDRKIYFTLNRPTNVRINVLSNGGTLSMTIGKEGEKKPLYTGEDIPTTNFEVELEAGDYVVKAYGEKHNGGYSIFYI